MSTIDRTREAPTADRGAAQKAPSSQHNFLPPLNKGDFNRAGKLASNVSIALEALWANKLRSMLTTLGIFIGIAAVIAALILTQGVSASITNTISSLGTNVITVSPGTAVTRGAFAAAGTSQTLTTIDATSISKLPYVSSYTPVVSQNEQVIYGNQNWNSNVQGVMPSYQQIQNWTLSAGSWYTSANERDGRAVAVIGQTIVSKLFANGDDPVGKKIRIGNDIYQIVGVLTSKSSGGSQDDVIDIPFSTGMARLKNTGYVNQILVQVSDSSLIDPVQSEIKTQIERNHNISGGKADDFNLSNSQQLLQTASTFTSLLTALLVGIAGISLTVGGIGIMNIMIVSVTERTREIGIRISIGAQREDIRNQFLIEALVLSVAGGIIGMLIGLGIGFLVTYLIKLPFVVSATTLLLPFVISACIGVAFGLYPAIRAARLDPIDALRSL